MVVEILQNVEAVEVFSKHKQRRQLVYDNNSTVSLKTVELTRAPHAGANARLWGA